MVDFLREKRECKVSATEAEIITAINYQKASIIGCQTRIAYDEKLLATHLRELETLITQLAALKRLREGK